MEYPRLQYWFSVWGLSSPKCMVILGGGALFRYTSIIGVKCPRFTVLVQSLGSSDLVLQYWFSVWGLSSPKCMVILGGGAPFYYTP